MIHKSPTKDREIVEYRGFLYTLVHMKTMRCWDGNVSTKPGDESSLLACGKIVQILVGRKSRAILESELKRTIDWLTSEPGLDAAAKIE